MTYCRTDKLVAAALLLISSSVLATALRLTPSATGYGTHTQLGLPPCYFLLMTHLPCPSCGLTTCFAWAVRFRFGNAFLANPFGLVAFLCTVSLVPATLFSLLRRVSFRRITEGAYFSKALYSGTALYFASWGFKLAQFRFAGH